MKAAQWSKAWHIAAKDMRTYYLKPPLISWGLLFPAVLIAAFQLRNPTDMRTVVPGLVGMTALFGASSVEAVVIAFEKRIGAMERLLIAPVSPAALLIGKALSGTLFGTATGVAVWLGSSLAWGLPLAAGVPLPVILLGSATSALLGVLLSLLVREVFDAMTLANLFRVPMIFFSGVFLPVGAMAPTLRVVAFLLPLTYTVDALRHLLLGGEGAALPLGIDLAICAAFGLCLYIVALWVTRRRLEELV